MGAQIAWPVVVLSHDDSFVHVVGNPTGLREHVAADLRSARLGPIRAYDSASELGFFDCDGYHLTPRLGQQWLLLALDRTSERTTPAMLVRRMAVAALTAQELMAAELVQRAIAEGIPAEVAQLVAKGEAPPAPMPEGRNLREYAELILAELTTADSDWFHKLMHAGNQGPEPGD